MNVKNRSCSSQISFQKSVFFVKRYLWSKISLQKSIFLIKTRSSKITPAIPVKSKNNFFSWIWKVSIGQVDEFHSFKLTNWKFQCVNSWKSASFNRSIWQIEMFRFHKLKVWLSQTFKFVFKLLICEIVCLHIQVSATTLGYVIW